jgi:hypothetical protein
MEDGEWKCGGVEVRGKEKAQAQIRTRGFWIEVVAPCPCPCRTDALGSAERAILRTVGFSPQMRWKNGLEAKHMQLHT